MSEILKDFVCPLCKWTCSNQNQMSVHIKFGHSQDEINEAVDDGRIIEDPTFFFTPAAISNPNKVKTFNPSRYHRIICEFCHSDSKFNFHHKTYERLGNERDTDLVILCDNCHERVHDLAKKIGISTAMKRVRKSFLNKKGRF